MITVIIVCRCYIGLLYVQYIHYIHTISWIGSVGWGGIRGVQINIKNKSYVFVVERVDRRWMTVTSRLRAPVGAGVGGGRVGGTGGQGGRVEAYLESVVGAPPGSEP